ncbi:hypothetical protein BEP19_07360 [Ammoniphilus oxalaticus]|uniref:DUF327 domain-containing protein n=2 Tax=Ammoniphilus oxalaticus TaxID=66863 RepID=A0A419SL84_9BACL|nr:hypothetical protein BEP19_07360 [Ammoniphilus oxalaticus]
MKVSEGLRLNSEARLQPNERAATQSASFRKLMVEQQHQLSSERLQQLLQEVEQRGEQLRQRQTIEQLRAYQASVRKFVKEAVDHGVGLKETRGFSFRGDERRLKIVQQLDEKLLALTDQLLEEQETTIDLLDRIGEIKGLLLNLIT